jgi:hypothetical protein
MEVESVQFQNDWPIIVVIEGEPTARTAKITKILAQLCRDDGMPATVFPMQSKYNLENVFCSLTLDAVDGAVNIFDRLHISPAAATTRDFGAVTEGIEAVEALLDGMCAIKVMIRNGRREITKPNIMSLSKFKRVTHRWHMLDEFVSSIEGCKKYEQYEDTVLIDIAESIKKSIDKLKGAS